MIKLFTIRIGTENQDLYELTIPKIQEYAQKIGAEFIEITGSVDGFEPNYSITKIYELGKDSDYNIYIDADYLIKSNMFNVIDEIDENTIGHFGGYDCDPWFVMDEVFKSDTKEVVINEEDENGNIISSHTETRPRYIGFNTGFLVVPKNCHEVFKPLDMQMDEIVEKARRPHYFIEYCLARNVAQNKYQVKELLTPERKKGAQGNWDCMIHLQDKTKRKKVDLVRAYLNNELEKI